MLSSNPLARVLLDVRDLGLEWVFKRYYGMYGGEVVDNEDKSGQGRVTVKVGALGVGTIGANETFDATPLSQQAVPSSPYAGKNHGFYFPPEKGDAVWVTFDHGVSTKPKPRYIGSWWTNRDAANGSAASELPAEFKMDGEPKRRGIKTAYGHGIIFSDEESAPYVAIWSGRQVKDGEPATRKQQITLSDTAGAPTVAGVDSDSVDEGIYANTAYGLRLGLNDTAKKVVISGKAADPAGVTANSISIEDTTGTITIKTKNQQSIIIDDKTGAITITGTGQINVLGPVCNVTTPTFNLTGANIVQTAAATMSLTGAASMSLVSAVLTLTAPVLSIISPLLSLGGPGGVPLTTSALIGWLQAHTHSGPGTIPNEWAVLNNPGFITTATKAL